MKKPLILAVAAMALTAGAQAESKFYGKMNVSVGYDDASEALKLNSNASRLGVKGSSDLGTSKVIYQAEFELAADDGYATNSANVTTYADSNTDTVTVVDTDSNTLKPRDTYVGLAYEGLGTVKMGIMDTPLKKSQGKFDLFNDVFDIKGVLDGEKRLGNSVNYTTEKIGNVQASVAVVMMEDGSDDGISANVIYKAGDIYASVAMDNKTEDADTSTIRATAIYTMGDLRLGALVNNVDASDTNDAELGFAVNASMKMGKNTAKVQFASADQSSLGETSLSLGVDHKLAKSTKAFAYVNLEDADAVDSDKTTMQFGLVHKF